MRKFLFISNGFVPPTPEVMDAWSQWFGKIGDRILDQAGLTSGRSFTEEGMKPLSTETEAATGYIIFTAEDLEAAESIVKACPIVASNTLHEIMTKEDC